MRTFYTIAIALLALPAYAQRYEFGLHGGYSKYLERTATTPRATAGVGFKHGYGFGFTLGHDMYEWVGGEVRYTFLMNDARLASGGAEVPFGSDAHAVHYDLLFHGARRSARIRPYGAVGGGVKYYRGTGAERAVQPLSNVAFLTKTNEVKPMISVGGGVKFVLSDRVVFRVDVHDFITQIPKNVIVPAPGASFSGWLHNLVPTVGITFTF